MLLERASNLEAKIAEYQKIRAKADKAEQFQTRAKLFGEAAERLTRVRDILSKFADTGVASDFVPTDAVHYAAKAKTLRTAISEDPAKIIDPPFDLKHQFTDRLTGIAAAAEEAMTKAWKAHVESGASFESNDVLNALAEVPQFRTSVTKIRRCRADIVALSNELPIDPLSAVERLKTLVTNHDAAWRDLSAEDIPPAVLLFIHASTSEGAPLSTYTDEVRSWLESRNLFNAFRIRIRRNA